MIVVIEDDNSIQELLSYALQANNYKVKLFSDSKNVMDFLENNTVDIVLLDIMLPGKSGLEILQEIRSSEKFDSIYIIMLTAKSEEYSKVAALDAGADDYLTKPFSVLELISRVKSTLRRLKKNNDVKVEIHYKNLVINKVERQVKIDNVNIDLTLKEYELLLLLLENQGRALTREVIFEKIWDYDFSGNSRTLDVHIRSLRSKIKNISDDIETIRGVGFKVRKVNYD